MGSCQASSMMSNRNKEFQSVVPFPNATSESSQASKKKRSSPNKSNRTAPLPGQESENVPVLSTDIPEPNRSSTDTLVKMDVKDPPSSSAMVGPFTDETMKCDVSTDSAYMQTESQQRRERMADCEFECSKITSYLFVGGYHVATNRDILRLNNITHIVNCSAAVVENAFIEDSSLKYLSLSMVDGRQDDISWFLCEVIQFIMKARSVGGKILIHCEKGISRSCSFAIAYRMWATGEKWKTSFDFVKKGRSICSPNTAFTCNLIELGELLGKDAAATGAGGNLLFRCAYHLPHDPQTAVLKLCRTAESRKVMVPATTLLDPKGVFIIRTVFSHDETVNREAEEHRLFLWQGAESTDACAKSAEALAKKMHGVLTSTDKVEWIKQGQESVEFLSYLVEDGQFSPADNSIFDDFYDYPPSEEQTLISARQMEADHTRNNSRDKDTFGRPAPLRESSIKGFAEYREGPLSRESSIRSVRSGMPLVSRESSIRTEFLLGRTGSVGTSNTGFQLDLLGMRALNGTGQERSESKIDRLDSNPLSSGGGSSTESRRNSDVSAFAQSRIPSIQLPDMAATADPEQSTGKRTSPSSQTEPSAVPRRNIPELVLNTGNKPASLVLMQRVSEGDTNFSELNSSRLGSGRDTGRDTGRDSSAEVRGAVPTKADSPMVLRLDNSKMNSKRQNSGTDGLSRDYISPDISTEELPRKSSITLPAIQLPGMLTPQLSLKIPLGSRSNSIKNEVVNTNSSISPNNSAQSAQLHTNSASPPGKLAIPLYLQPQEDIHRQGSQEKLRLFSSNNRVAPGPTGESPRHGSPRSDLPPTGSRPTSASLSLSLGHSPLADRRIAGSTASILATLGHGTSSNNNSTSNLHNGLVAPLKVLERSPSHERVPLDVGLQRGPTPIEDLTTPRSVPRELNPSTPTSSTLQAYSHSPGTLLSPSQIDSSQMRRSESKISVSEMAKPLLFQAVLLEAGADDTPRTGKRTASGSNVARYEWQAMGVYDDEDLDASSLFLLLCPTRSHYIWLGSDFPAAEVGLVASETDESDGGDSDGPSSRDVLRWAAAVLQGEVAVDQVVGANMLNNSDYSVERCGEESESFWQDFNDGF